jgi:hypothetical protein
MGFRQESGNLQSVIIGINKTVKSAQSVVLLLASVFCLRQTQVFTSEPKSVSGLYNFRNLSWVKFFFCTSIDEGVSHVLPLQRVCFV